MIWYRTQKKVTVEDKIIWFVKVDEDLWKKKATEGSMEHLEKIRVQCIYTYEADFNLKRADSDNRIY